MQRSVATPSTRSTSSAVQHPSRVQQKGEVGFSPLVRGILIGIAAVVLLAAVGLLLLLKWLMPVKWVKLPPSGAAPWQRVRPTSLHGNMNSSSDSTQQLPTTDAFIPPARNSMPSLSSTTSQDEPVWGGDHCYCADAPRAAPGCCARRRLECVGPADDGLGRRGADRLADQAAC